MTDRGEARSEQARRDLARLERQGETIGGTATDAASRGLAKPEADDAVERLGRKIGRGLAFAALPFVVFWFGRQAAWW